MFNATPDSYLFEIKRLVETYGYPSSYNTNAKVLGISLYSNYTTKLSDKYLFKLNVNHANREVILKISNLNGILLDDKCRWSFELLKEKLYRKLKYLILVKTIKVFKNNKFYYKYISYKFYKLRDFDKFIECIEKGYVRITFKINIYRTGIREGKIYDHGTGFSIDEKNLYRIFKKINI